MTTWYLVFTKPKEEFRAKRNLEQQCYETYLPQVKRGISSKKPTPAPIPMFPRYMFVVIDPQKDDVSKIRNTKGVVGLVSFGPEMAKVPEDVIDQVKRSEKALNTEEKKTCDRKAIFCVGRKEERVMRLIDLVSRPKTSQVPNDVVDQLYMAI
ncbi:transcriptional activator RfaH [Teredinibacter franksiae]|jgi:Transcription antiterminator|uniref:transcriptional activator RfaH n=1 Tax=Teredinibacter franksiae TaxID=2761453 RepID=UPI001628018A|nr:transcriptional activator RfaH [Teredinibacter franksiae]